MNEFIEKLIGRLEEEMQWNCSHCKNDAIEIVNELAEEYKGGWIPCSERLPIGDEYKRRYDGETYYKQVLAMTNETEVPMYIGWYDQENERWYDKDGFAFYPIAWQPLPEPYCEKS